MNDFQKGQKIIIKFDISEIRSYEFTCTLKRVEFDRLFLNFPSDKKDFIKYLRDGKEIQATIYTDNGVYVFDAVIIESPFNIDFVIELPEETTKIQHRKYQRIPINLSLKLVRNKKVLKTTTVNISGGGIRFRVNNFIDNGNIWNFILALPNGESVIGYGEIIYSIKENEYNMSVIKFIDISESDRSKIIKLTYDEEVKSLLLTEQQQIKKDNIIHV